MNLDDYCARARKLPRLTRDDERALMKRYRDGDVDAGNRLVEGSLMFAVQKARRYGRARHWDIDDIVQAANLGLIKALEKFDPERSSFITYADHWIRLTVTRYMADTRVVRMPKGPAGQLALQLMRRNGTVDAEAIEKADPYRRVLPETARAIADHAMTSVVSTEIPVHSDGAANEWAVTIGETLESHDDEVDPILRRSVARALGGLTPNERFVVDRVVMASVPKTEVECAEALGVTRQCVHGIYKRALAKLRRSLASAREAA